MLFQIIDAIRGFPRRFFTDLEIAPTITLSDTEHRQLTVIAMTGVKHDSKASDRLHWKLDRARVVPENELAEGIVRMGSVVRYRMDDGVLDTARLVYPALVADYDDVSILSLLGTALIGVAVGSTVPLSFVDDTEGSLTLLSVTGP